MTKAKSDMQIEIFGTSFCHLAHKLPHKHIVCWFTLRLLSLTICAAAVVAQVLADQVVTI